MNPRCVEYEKMTEPKMTEGCIQEPMYECPQERVVNREMCYEVPHSEYFIPGNRIILFEKA